VVAIVVFHNHAHWVHSPPDFFSQGIIITFDPTLPVNNSLISSSELRNQLNGLKTIIEQNVSNAAVSLTNAIAGTAVNPAVNLLGQSISNPPTQAQVQAIQNKINELINAITRPAA